MGFIHSAEYRRLKLIQRGCCYICGSSMNKPTRDHVRPRSRYPSAQPIGLKNILLAHGACNTLKGDRDPHPCELIYLEAAHLIFDAMDKRRNRDIASSAVS